MSTAYRTLTVHEAAARLVAIERPLILTHRNPDGDTVGSAAALLAFYRALGREAFYAAEGEIPERLAFLLEGERRAYPPFEGLTPVAVDVASPAQLGALQEQLAEGAVALSIDHHAVGVPFADTLCMPDASSAGEVLFHVLTDPAAHAVAPMSPAVAGALYASVASDTGGFRFANTSPDTHRIAAQLLSFGFDAADICHRLFFSRSAAQLRAEGLTALALRHEGAIAYAVITKRMRDAEGLTFDDFDCAIDVVRSLRGCEIAFVVKETDAGSSKISLRSTGADVARIAAALGGGGHIRAAGCSQEAPPSEAAARILALLREV